MRWMPAVVVPAVIAVAVVAVPLQAGAVVDLPDKTAAEVLALVSDSTVSSFSGTIEQTSNLGLPDLGSALSGMSTGSSDSGTDAAASAATTALELLTGSHTARVFADGPGNLRVQVIDRLDERNLIVNGDEVWFYDSDSNEATHLSIPAGTEADARAQLEEAKTKAAAELGEMPTPAELADTLLADLDSSTEVTVGTDTAIAGRDAYELRLTPRTDETLVASASIFVDSETGMPLSVNVRAQGQQDPAFQVAFTEVSFTAPDAALFTFTPPAGATVTEQALPDHDGTSDHDFGEKPAGDLPVTVTGEGWAAVAELPAGTVDAEVTASPLFTQVTTAITGGYLFSTSLLNVLVTDDGRVLAGSVPVESLQAAAAE
ncbi:outer membrane lipoprotein carrier protein LolA [Cryobacterium melibiosiphilum]|uniref:Outer membrane lipoprotein carrier protein LolA n=1 Tax=Cryobacterium melibiosiphilum TaxID=995039 RepID=A0A3A5MJ94_9MICO|nr:outer membrane lipoprotein carrier protein LolA [Cryobacterium melibiosiphilum]